MAAPNIDTQEIVKAQRVIDAASAAVMTFSLEIGLPIRTTYVHVYENWAEVTLDSHERLFKNVDGKRNLTRKTFIIAPGLWSDMAEAAEFFKAKRR